MINKFDGRVANFDWLSYGFLNAKIGCTVIHNTFSEIVPFYKGIKKYVKTLNRDYISFRKGNVKTFVKMWGNFN